MIRAFSNHHGTPHKVTDETGAVVCDGNGVRHALLRYCSHNALKYNDILFTALRLLAAAARAGAPSVMTNCKFRGQCT